MATSLERSQPNFTAIVYARRANNLANLAKIGRVCSEEIALKGIVKQEAFSAVRGHSRSLKMASFDRSHREGKCAENYNK